MRTKIVYLIVMVLILASWIVNYSTNRISQLPEVGFLRHHIEVMDTPSFALELLYVANKGDKRKIMNVRIEELPTLRFYPVQVQENLKHQTVYLLRGYFDLNDQENRAESPALRIHSVQAYFNDGSVITEDVGEIIVYRKEFPPSSGEGPIQMSSSSSSSDHEGSLTSQISRPITITGISSAMLGELGKQFQYEVNVFSERENLSTGNVAYPLELRKGQSLILKYKFLIPRQSPQSLEVYKVLLQENFEDVSGGKWTNEAFANYIPYPTEAQMQAYVREKEEGCKVNKAYTRIVWGLALELIDFKIQNFDIFPDVIGYLLIFIGLSALRPTHRYFSIAWAAAGLQLIVSVVSFFGLPVGFSLTDSETPSFAVLLLSSIVTVFELVMMYGICKGIRGIGTIRGKTALADSARDCWRLLFVLGAVLLFLLPFQLNTYTRGSDSFSIFIIILGFSMFLASLWVIAIVRRAGRELRPGEGNPNDPAGRYIDLIV